MAIDPVCIYILTDIYNLNLFDLTLKFENTEETLNCKKFMLRFIPYFDMLFNDVEITDSITISQNYEITKIIIMMLHNQNIKSLVTKENAINIILQMDLWLMRDHYKMLIKHISGIIEDVIKDELEQKNYEKIVLFNKILKNLPNEKSHHVKNYKNKEKKESNKLQEKMLELDVWNEHIFIFNHWNLLFNDNQKLKAIFDTKQYELLNISNITPAKVIIELAKRDFTNDFYYYIYDNCDVSFIANHNDTHNIQNRIINKRCIISQYYPKFVYYKYENLNDNFIMVINNIITDKINISVSIGDKLLHCNNNYFETCEVTEIIKINNKAKVEVKNTVPNNLTNCIQNIYYEIYVDKNLTNYSGGHHIFKITSYNFNNDCSKWQ